MAISPCLAALRSAGERHGGAASCGSRGWGRGRGGGARESLKAKARPVGKRRDGGGDAGGEGGDLELPEKGPNLLRLDFASFSLLSTAPHK